LVKQDLLQKIVEAKKQLDLTNKAELLTKEINSEIKSDESLLNSSEFNKK
jgi:hypothetical protein